MGDPSMSITWKTCSYREMHQRRHSYIRRTCWGSRRGI